MLHISESLFLKTLAPHFSICNFAASSLENRRPGYHNLNFSKNETIN